MFGQAGQKRRLFGVKVLKQLLQIGSPVAEAGDAASKIDRCMALYQRAGKRGRKETAHG